MLAHLFLMDGILLFASDEIMIHFDKENSPASVRCDVILVFWTDTSWFQHTVFRCKFMLNVILISSIGYSWIFSFYWGLNDLRLKHHIWLACIIPVYTTIHPSFHIFLCKMYVQSACPRRNTKFNTDTAFTISDECRYSTSFKYSPEWITEHKSNNDELVMMKRHRQTLFIASSKSLFF